MALYQNQDQETLDAMMVCAKPLQFSRREVINITFGLRDVMFPDMETAKVWEVCDNLVERFDL